MAEFSQGAHAGAVSDGRLLTIAYVKGGGGRTQSGMGSEELHPGNPRL